MAITTTQAQGLVLALFGASAGGHLTGLAAASNLNTLAGDLSTSAGLILGKDLSSNTAFRDHVTANLKLSGDALTAANAWLDGQLNAGAARGDIIATAVTFLSTLTDTTSPFYASAQAFQTTVTAAVAWSTGAGATQFGVAALRAQQGNVDVVAGSSFTLTTGTDTLVGTSGNDTFTSAAGTLAAGDLIADSSNADQDVANLTVTAAGTTGAARVSNVETVNVQANSLSAITVDAANFTGVKTLNVTRGNVEVGGTTLTGNKAVAVTNLDGTDVAAVTVGAGATTVAITQTDRAGAVINADSAAGAGGGTTDIDVTGAATINAAGLGTGDGMKVTAFAAAETNYVAENAKPVSVTTNAAATVAVANGAGGEEFTGVISVTANQAATVTVAAAKGGATVNAAKASTATVNGATGGATVVAAITSTADSTVTVTGIDSSGANVTVGSGLVATATGKQVYVDLSGTTAVSDKATVSGAGFVYLDVGKTTAAVDNITLSGSTGAVSFVIASTNGVASNYTVEGTNAVTLRGDVSEFDTTTVTGAASVVLTAGTAGDFDLTDIGSKIVLGFDNLGDFGGTENVITTANNATVELTSDQTDLVFGLDAGATRSDLNVIAGDEDPNSSTVGTINVVDFDTNAGAASGTVTITANDSNFTANSVTLGSKQNLVLEGDEDFTLGTVAGGNKTSVNGANVTGNISLTVAALAATVATGSGDDTVTANGDLVHTVSTGAGVDSITITSTAATSTFDGGDGDDSFTLTDTDAYVVIGGSGADTFTTSAAIDARVLGGDGTDTLITSGGAIDVSAKAQFGVDSVEQLNITAGNFTARAAAFTGKAISIIADGDTLQLTNHSTTTGTMDFSGLTIKSGSTATLSFTGNTGADTITGGVKAETINATGGADVINGGDGSDTYVLTTGVTETGSAGASIGMVINLGSTAVTGTSVFAGVGRYISAAATEVAGGTAMHMYAASSSSNAATVQSISNIENITGTAEKDYIVGSAGDNTIIGGSGNDFLRGGSGADTFGFNAPSTDGTDTIADFAAGDIINVNSTSTLNTYREGAVGSVVNTDEIVVITGAAHADAAALYTAGTFSAASSTVIVFLDSDTTTVKVYYDADGETGGADGVEIAELTGITTLAGLAAAFADGSITLY